MQKIRQGDIVKIISGKDAGKTGEVVRVFPKKSKLVVKGVNIVTKHKRQTTDGKGGRIKVESPIPQSKVMIIDSETGKPSRIRFSIDKKTNIKKRVVVRSGKILK